MPNPKLIIGLTGGIASGKSTVAKIFNDLGIAIIDADIAARKVVQKNTPGLNAIIERYGQSILLEGYQLDRTKLGEIIFSDESERLWLNGLLHPMIRQWMQDQNTKATSAYIINMIPLLIESNLMSTIDKLIVVDVPVETQIQRLIARDNCPRSHAEKILSSQTSRADRLSHADYVIDNTEDILYLEKSVKKLHNQLLTLATDKNA